MTSAPLTLLRTTLTASFTSVRGYTWGKARSDLIAGLTVTAVEIPQSMAYAIVAGVPPQYGLYTSFIQGLLGPLMSSSEHLLSGPTNTQALLVAATVARVAGADPATYLELVFALTLLKGICQMVFGLAQIGTMVRYVSRAVFSGVSAGAGMLIFLGQLPVFLGVHPASNRTGLPGIADDLWRLAGAVTDANWRSMLLGILCIAAVLISRRVSRFIPGTLIAVVGTAVVVYVMGWTGGQLDLIGAIPSAVPHFHVPHLSAQTAETLISGALALAVMGMLESVVIVKSIAAHTGERIDANQEFLGQGIKNIVSSFLQCIPGSGSFSRSALAFAAGAQTRFAAVSNALFIAIAAILLAGEARYIPRTCLAAILLVISIDLIDFGYIRRIARSSRQDMLVCVITILATLLAPLQYAIFIGVFINLAMYIRQASHLHLAEMVPTEGGKFIEKPLRLRSGQQAVTLIQMEGDLFFGVADELQDRLNEIERSSVRVAIFRMKRTHSVDSTVMHVMERFIRDMHEHDRHVIFCGVRYETLQVFKSYGLIGLLGKENVFETGQGVFVSVKQAIERARKLVNDSIDATGIDIDDEGEEFVYEI